MFYEKYFKFAPEYAEKSMFLSTDGKFSTMNVKQATAFLCLSEGWKKRLVGGFSCNPIPLF